MARSRYKIYDDNFPYFVTGTIVDWLPLFSKPDLVQIILDTLTFLQEMDRMILYAYVVMENHIHMIASSGNLSKELGDFKSYTARKIIDRLKKQSMDGILYKLAEEKRPFKNDRIYQFWQEGSHPQRIHSHDMMVQKVEYIHNNPVKRGYIANPVHWRYSSAGNYQDGTGLIPVCTEW